MQMKIANETAKKRTKLKGTGEPISLTWPLALENCNSMREAFNKFPIYFTFVVRTDKVPGSLILDSVSR